MNPLFLTLIELLIGTAENVVPMFIHNPKSGKIEGIIATVVNSVMSSVPVAPAPVQAPVAPAAPSGPTLTPFKAI